MDTKELNYSTVRIHCNHQNGTSSSGTGFIIRFAEQTINGKYASVPCIVTNKHVIRNAHEITVRFHSTNLDGTKTKKHCQFTFDLSKLIIMHPDDNVDLCAIPIETMYRVAFKDNIKPHYYGISLHQISKEEALKEYYPSEDIVVVGYPNGIWDELHNLPVFRKGTLATMPSVNYKAKKEFLIDCAIYPGSSGSPVFSVKQLFNPDTYEPFTSIKLLGVVYATYQHNARGETITKDIPTNIIATPVPNHLGIVINSSRIMELDTIIRDYFSDVPADDILQVD
ncbi:serine protease [Salipaludibacillus sp. CUR1]|uniref:S1 family peptidase n=1 Tax=Salipaludibacillus sp. CUR1 TaxID=2820003 RepID=UPI001E4CC621|nr:serine protease [Salipaludibacillus sp. CUR1]MCE7792299.1 serine protease [Salipaludibacillus sp. CUR1]